MDDCPKQFQALQLILIEGVHFINPREYFKLISIEIDLLAIIFPLWQHSILRREVLSLGETQIQSNFTIKTNGGSSLVFLRQIKNFDKNQADYWVNSQKQQLNRLKQADFRLEFKIEVQLSKDKMHSRSIIKLVIKRYSQSPIMWTVFGSLIKMGNNQYTLKKNYLKNCIRNQLIYPKYTLQAETSEKEQIILLLNQRNMKDLTFFQSALRQIHKNDISIRKIIGHASSIFLPFLFNAKGQFCQQISDLMINYHKIGRNRLTNKPNKNEGRQKKVKHVMLKMLLEQNILDTDLIQFVVQNIVNQAFVEQFKKLIQLYYRIFINEELSFEQIDQAIDNSFYMDSQSNFYKDNNIFSSLFAFLQYKHNLEVQDLSAAIGNAMCKSIVFENLTLESLYEYNKIQYTFIAIDLNDSIVRFLNHQTAPKMPISAIISLIQFLPVSYKSVVWREQWGRYKIHYSNSIKQINITNHQIIDSRFLLQCPLDLLNDPIIRECYLNRNCSKERIHAISVTRTKVEDLKCIDELKALLKQLKSNAIDSIPKIKLIWKLLMSKNNVDIDINDPSSMVQIPILDKLVKLDITFKKYLQNLNNQANSQLIIKTTYGGYYSSNLFVETMSRNMDKLVNILEQFNGKNINICKKGNIQMHKELDFVESHWNNYYIKSYDEMIVTLQALQRIIKTYDIIGKSKYQLMMDQALQEMDKHYYAPLQMQKIVKLISAIRIGQINSATHHNEKDVECTSFLKDSLQSPDQQHEVYLQLKNLLDQQKKFRTKLRLYITEKIQRQLLSVQYQTNMYKFCLKLYSLFEKKSNMQQIHTLYKKIFEVTPYLFNHQIMKNHQFYSVNAMDNIISRKTYENVHLVLGGQSRTMIDIVNAMLQMRERTDRKNIPITNITATNYHALLAVLYSLDLNKDQLMEEIVALEQLVKTNISKINGQNFDIVDLYVKQCSPRYYASQQEIKAENKILKNNLIKDNPNIINYCSKLEEIFLYHQYKVNQIYKQLTEYNDTYGTGDTTFKEKQIILNIQDQIQQQKAKIQIKNIIKQNEKLIKQKLKGNHVGVRFVIKFFYRDLEKENNWVNIHKEAYKDTDIYRTYIIRLLNKYNIDPQISLQEFNQTNFHKIKLNFVLMNQSKLRYELINGQTQPKTKIIDLLIAAICCQAEFATQGIMVESKQNEAEINNLINKIDRKIGTMYQQQQYLSNFQFNSLPFNLIRRGQQSSKTLFLSFWFAKINEQQLPQTTIPAKLDKNIRQIGIKQKATNQSNLGAVDLVSMWWTKPKKLTPELKKIIFSNIFESPFMRLYFFMQNSSFEDLNAAKDERKIVNIDERKDNNLKGRMIGYAISKQRGVDIDWIILRLSRISPSEIEICYFSNSGSYKSKLVMANQTLSECSTVITNFQLEKELIFYLKGQNKLWKCAIKIFFENWTTSVTYIQGKIDLSQQNPLTLNEIEFNEGDNSHLQLKSSCTYQQFQNCNKCKSLFFVDKKCKNATCQMCSSLITPVLNKRPSSIRSSIVKDIKDQPPRMFEKKNSKLKIVQEQKQMEQQEKQNLSYCCSCFGCFKKNK